MAEDQLFLYIPQEEWDRLATNPNPGLESWLPKDWIEAGRTGKPYKYPQWYLDFGKKVEWLSEITLEMIEQVNDDHKQSD